MKKIFSVILASALILFAFAACSPKTTSEITVVSREEGSGTRGAFIELVGVEKKDANGTKVDYTTEEASISNSTSVVMTSVSGNSKAIGYISLGSLNSTVKALKVDGVEPTVGNVKSGNYKVARPFNIATKGDVSPASQDFINYIMSSLGQAVVEESGYVSASNNGDFVSNGASGKVVVAGSSSVTPVMEKLKESFAAVNIGIEVEVQQSDSSTGMNSAIEGICDVGVASRELKDSELAELDATVIAMDGIAIIVHNDNAIEGLTTDQVRDIYTGDITDWSEVE